MHDVALLTNNRSLQRHMTRAIASLGCAVYTCPLDQQIIVKELSQTRGVYIIDADIGEPKLSWLLGEIKAKDRAAAVLLTGSDPDFVTLVRLLEDGATRHIVSRHTLIPRDLGTPAHACLSSPIDERELAVICKKLITRDIFGLHKHLFTWGVKVHQLTLTHTAEKAAAITAVEHFLLRLDCHQTIIPAITLVVDELLMNAFFNAPRDNAQQPCYRHVDRRQPITLPQAKAIDVQFACDGRYVGLSVTDRFGSLDAQTIIAYLKRCLGNVAAPADKSTAGAGLGLYMVWRSANRLVFNLEATKRTEVIALFYIRDGGRAFRSLGQSLHIFQGGPRRPRRNGK